MTDRGGKGPVDQPGLRMRMRKLPKRISNQHRQLDEFFAMVAGALEAKSVERARVEFGRFRDVFAKHIELENEVFFPALRGLSPDLEPEISDLLEEHTEFEVALERLEALLRADSVAGLQGSFERFKERFEAHEAREEGVIAAAGPPTAG